jgi:hypothetical protein
LLAPWGTITLFGIDAIAAAPERICNVSVVSEVTGIPNVTLPDELPPPTRFAGVRKKAVGTLPVTVSPAVLVVPFTLAATETFVMAVTSLVMRVNVPVVDPASTVTEGGIEFTADPPLFTANGTTVSTGAAPLSVTVPVLFDPPINVPGENLNAESVTADVTVRVEFLLPPLAVAETTTLVVTATVFVTKVNVALLLPASTVTDAGIEATAEFPLVTASVTVVFTGAVPLKVTVPVLLAPPTTADGLKANDAGVFGFTVKFPDALPPFRVADTVTEVALDTGFVVRVNEAVV